MEFVLVAPLLFLIFFSIIQFAYMAYVSLAVQRSALAVARSASLLRPSEFPGAFQEELTLSLLPIANLSHETLLMILKTQCNISYSEDGKQVIATVRYPMPVWVPLVRNLFGQDLIHATNYQGTPEGLAIQAAFSFLNIQPPDLTFTNVDLPVRWITFQATTHNEGTHG